MGVAEAGTLAPSAIRGWTGFQKRFKEELGRAEDSVSPLARVAQPSDHACSVCKSLLASPPFSRLSLSVRFFVPEVERLFNEAPYNIEGVHQELVVGGVLGDSDVHLIHPEGERQAGAPMDVQDTDFREQCLSKASQLNDPSCAVCKDRIDETVSICAEF